MHFIGTQQKSTQVCESQLLGKLSLSKKQNEKKYPQKAWFALKDKREPSFLEKAFILFYWLQQGFEPTPMGPVPWRQKKLYLLGT